MVCGEEVVLVDFDAARVYDVPTAEHKAWQDRSFVKGAFSVPIQEEE